MAQQIVNVGGQANDGTGDPNRTAFQKINANFSELYSRGAAGSNLDLSGNVISAVNTNGDVQLTPNGTGNIVIGDNAVIISSSKTPTTSVGAAGDKQGMVAWDASYVYVCTADYDGTTSVWKRSAISTW